MKGAVAMISIGELSRISGLSLRTLRYYDQINLLKPSAATEAGYRLYSDADLQRLHTIMLFRELEFPLAEIRSMLDTPSYDPLQALEAQIELLTLRREHINNLLLMAKGLKLKGLNHLHADERSFTIFDHRKFDAYVAQIKSRVQQTYASAPPHTENDVVHEDEITAFISRLGAIKHLPPSAPEVQKLMLHLVDFMRANAIPCTPSHLRSLADMADGGGDFTHLIDQTGGEGTASLLAQALRCFCTDVTLQP